MEVRKRARHDTIAPCLAVDDDAQRETENPRGILQEEDAWRLALTWQEVLQEVVQLVTSERFGRVIQTYEWVSLSLDSQQPWGTLIHQVYVFRAAVSVWTALSSCRGFSGRENPSFWKRVFGKLRECRSIFDEGGEVKENAHENPVIDAMRFFEVNGEDVFPSVMLSVENFDDNGEIALAKALFNIQEKTPEMEEVDRKLEAVLKELAPNLHSSWCQRVVPVMLGAPYENFPESAKDLAELLSSVASRETEPSPNCPMFKLSAIPFAGGLPSTTAELNHIKHLFQNFAIDIETYSLYNSTENDQQRDSAFIGITLGIDSSRKHRIRHATIGTNVEHFEAMISALPHTRSSESLTIMTCGNDEDELTSEQCSWIGYALFHPDAPTSCLTSMEFSGISISSEDVRIFQAMAQGNNLLAIRSWCPPRNTAYHSADLSSHSVVYSEPDPNSSILYTCQHSLSADICVWSDSEICSLPEWVAVIIPGYGLGWTSVANISNVTSRSPSTSCLKTLAFNCHKSFIDVVASLVALIGPQLKVLDIGSMGPIYDKSITRIFQVCPVLKSLRMCHNGSFWEKHVIEHGPQLEELALRVEPDGILANPSDRALQFSLNRLRVFRLEMKRQETFDRNRDVIRSIFSRLENLEYFHVSCEESKQPDQHEPVKYEEGLAKSWELMGCSPHGENVDTLIRRHVAFISALRAQLGSSMTLLHHCDLVKLIFGFHCGRVCKLWIDRKGKFVPYADY